MSHNIYNHRVLPQETDFNERITLSALGSLFLNTAGEDALRNHFGPDDLLKLGCGWVVSRFAMQMLEYPKMYDSLKVETWIEDFGTMFTARNFRLYDDKDRIIGFACTQWAVIDINSRRPVNLSRFADWQKFATGETIDMEKPVKIAEAGCECVSQHRVRYSDLDFNKHTNSMKYTEWMVDVLPLEKLENFRVKRFDINYLREARYGQLVNVCLLDSMQESHFELCDENGKALCRSLIQWEKEDSARPV